MYDDDGFLVVLMVLLLAAIVVMVMLIGGGIIDTSKAKDYIKEFSTAQTINIDAGGFMVEEEVSASQESLIKQLLADPDYTKVLVKANIDSKSVTINVVYQNTVMVYDISRLDLFDMKDYIQIVVKDQVTLIQGQGTYSVPETTKIAS